MFFSKLQGLVSLQKIKHLITIFLKKHTIIVGKEES